MKVSAKKSASDCCGRAGRGTGGGGGGEANEESAENPLPTSGAPTTAVPDFGFFAGGGDEEEGSGAPTFVGTAVCWLDRESLFSSGATSARCLLHLSSSAASARGSGEVVGGGERI